MINQQGHGFLRKTKAYGLCGIVLLGALTLAFNTSNVLAEDKDNVGTEQVANQVVTEPVTKDLANALEQAETVGVTVTQTTNQSVANQAEAQADYDSQAEAMGAVIAEQESINAENTEMKKQYDQDQTAYQEVTQMVKSTNQSVETILADVPKAVVVEEKVDYGDNDKAGYQKGSDRVTAVKQQNDLAYQDYKAKKAVVDAHNAKVKADEEAFVKSKLAEDKNNGVVVSGRFNDTTTGMDFYKDILVSYVGTDKNIKMTKEMGWCQQTSISDVQGMTLTNYADGTPNGNRVTSDVKPIYVLSDVNVGDSFKINHIGQTVDGKSLHAIVTVSKVEKDNADNSFFTVGYQDLGNNYNPVAFDYVNFSRIGLSVRYLDDLGNDVKLLQAFVVGDIDDQQAGEISFEGNSLNFVNPNGSDLVEAKWGLFNHNMELTDSLSSAPKGTFLAVGLSPIINYTHTTSVRDGKNPVTNRDNFIEFLLFGSAASVDTKIFVYEEEPKLSLIKVSEPVKPTLPPFKDSLSVSYHLNDYTNPLMVVKDVIKDNVSVNNQQLKIGDKATYTLTGAKILANGKDKLVKYDFEDMIDSQHDSYLDYRVYAFTPITLIDGTVIQSLDSLKAYAQQTYDEVTGRFYVSLNSDFLAKVAKSSDFQAKVEIDFERKSSGHVVNTFNNLLEFEDLENKIIEVSVPSNEVMTYTEEEPISLETPKEDVKTTLDTAVARSVPVQEQAILPTTGEVNSIWVMLFGVALTILGLASTYKRKLK